MSTVISPATGCGSWPWLTPGPGQKSGLWPDFELWLEADAVPAGQGSTANTRRTAAAARCAPGPAVIGVSALTWKLPARGRTDLGYGSKAARRSVIVFQALVPRAWQNRTLAVRPRRRFPVTCPALRYERLPDRRAGAASTGTWPSLVGHLTGGQGVAGSNPAVPTGRWPVESSDWLHKSQTKSHPATIRLWQRRHAVGVTAKTRSTSTRRT